MATQTATQPMGSLPGTQEGQNGRALRSGYRNLQARAIRDGEDLVSLEKSRLAEVLAEANTLQEQVQRPREQAVDSEVFAHLTDRGVELAKKLAHGGKGHTAKDFMRRLKAKYVRSSQAQDDGANDPGAFAWGSMGLDVADMFRGAPGVFCMVGPLDAKAKQRKVIVRREKQALAELTRPDELKDLDETEKQETDKNLDEMWAVLCEEGEVPLLELVLNHASFAQTVENLFSCSFLVKDGLVSLKKADEGVVVNKVAKNMEDGGLVPDVERSQLVINLTMDLWGDWKAVCAAGDCRMRHRVPRHGGAAAAAAAARPAEESEDEGDGAADQAGSPVQAAGSSRQRHGSAARSQQKGRKHAAAAAADAEDSAEEDEEEEEEPVVRKGVKRRK